MVKPSGRDEAESPVMAPNPTSVSCPLCGAPVGHNCVWKEGRRGGIASAYHYERIVKARIAERNPDATRKRVAREMYRP